MPASAAFDPIAPLRAVVEQVLATAHALVLPLGLDPAGGAGWLLAVLALVVVVRTALLPLAVLQARSQRRLQALAPELRRVRDRYRGRSDAAARQELAAATLALHREHGVHPLGAAVPALVQLPVLLALVQVLERAAHGTTGALASFGGAVVLGVPLSAGVVAGGTAAMLGIGLLAATAAAQVLTQRMAMRSAPEAAPRSQQVLLLALPLASVAVCTAFPIGVTAYWCCSALWTLGQQAVLTGPARARA